MGLSLTDSGIAHVLAHDAGILTLGQGVIVAVTRTRFGLLDTQFLQQSGHLAVDVRRAVVLMKALDLKRELESSTAARAAGMPH